MKNRQAIEVEPTPVGSNGVEAVSTANGLDTEPHLVDGDQEAVVYDELTYTPPGRSRGRIVVVALLGLAVLAALAFWLFRPAKSAPTAAVRLGTITSSVETTGKLEAATSAKLSFRQGGRVDRVLVTQGDFLEVGQVLAELDTSTVQRQLEEARVQLEISKLRLEQAKVGPQPAEIAAANADLDSAQVRLSALQTGARPEEVAGATAAVNQAQAKLDALSKTPTTKDLAGVQARLDQARSNRDLVVSTAANNKEQARLQLAAAQKALADGVGTQTQVDQARSNYNAAQSSETSQVASANAQVREAQAAFDTAKAGATAEEITASEEAVAQAQANLDQLLRRATPDELAEAESRVAAAQSALDRVNGGPTETEIAILEQGVALSQLAVDQANAQIAESRLVAPFSGTVLSLSLQAGEIVGGAQAVAVLADTATLRIRGDIDEIDVGRVRAGQLVTVTLDAYPGVTMPGEIISVSPGATQKQGSTVYSALITFNATGEVVPREGMAANVDITSQRKENALLVPNRALERVGDRQYVTLHEASATRKVEVETGLSNRTETEILSGLSDGQLVLLR